MSRRGRPDAVWLRRVHPCRVQGRDDTEEESREHGDDDNERQDASVEMRLEENPALAAGQESHERAHAPAREYKTDGRAEAYEQGAFREQLAI